MLNCHDATRLMSESQEHALSLLDRMVLRAHVMMCDGCRNFEKHLPVLRRAARSFARGRDDEMNAK